MARIRTIKPDFFRNYKLYKAEIEEKLPLRVAFAGLWTACDREGRFKWIPETLKLDCLPFDICDFSRVLDALLTRGYIFKYSVNETENNDFYGYIPTWKDHQVINNREAESILPNPEECYVLTRDARVPDASVKLQSGKERKGKERERKGKEDNDRDLFDSFRKKYPGTKRGNDTEFENFQKKHNDWKDILPLLETVIDNQIMSRDQRKMNKEFVPEWKNLQTWINQRCWEEILPSSISLSEQINNLHAS